MKRIVSILTAVLMVAVFAAGCSNKNIDKETEGKVTTTEDKLKVVASFYPMYDFAMKIGGDKVTVTDMVPAGIEPHDWEPAASDIANLEEADVFVYNGAGMEHWVDTVLDSLGNKDLVTVEAASGITLMEGHGHEDGEEEHSEEEEEEHGDEEGMDPHVWLNPLNAKAEMENIKNAFIEADPDNKDYYTANYETYAAKLDELDQKFKETLTGFENKDIIVAHEAFGYLCSAYGLNQVGIEGLSPDSEPDPAKMEEVIQFAKENEVKVIFFEELVSPKVAETIAKEIGATTDVLNPLEGLSEEDLKNGADYFTVMEQNLTSLVKALQ